MCSGAPEVHQTRVAAGRLRSTLRIFGDVVDAAPAEELNNELVWYAGLLGQVRDRDVLSRRLTKLIADLRVDQVRGPVEAEITKALVTGRDGAIQRLNEAMRTRRYQHLTQLLRGWKTAPPRRKADKRLRRPDATPGGCVGPARCSKGRATQPNSSSRPTTR
jgi:CHAD domain-containing protein